MKLTQKYFYKKRSFLLLRHFFSDIYKSGKLVEFFSFVIWEVLHRIGLFKKNQYMFFENEKPLVQLANLMSNNSLRIDDNIEIKKSEIEWTLSFIDANGIIWGCIRTDEKIFYKCVNNELIKVNQFPLVIRAIYISKQQIIFVCIFGILYRSDDNGCNFISVLEFSSPKSRFIHNNCFTEKPDGELFLGEYANVWELNKWRFVGYLYQSKDQGKTWVKNSFLKKAKVNKHIHIVKYSSLINGLVLTDGDNKKLLWINNSSHYESITNGNQTKGWKKITKYHLQTGGYSAMVELDNKVIFGSDYLGGTNFLITTKDMNLFHKQIVPDPYRRSFFTNMVVRKNNSGIHEIWAVLHSSFSSKTKSLLMFSANSGKSWKKVIEYDGTTNDLSITSSSINTIDTLHVVMAPVKAPRVTLSVNNYISTIPSLIFLLINTHL